MMTLLDQNNTKMLIVNSTLPEKSLGVSNPHSINAIEEAQTFRVSIVQREILPGYVISQNGPLYLARYL